MKLKLNIIMNRIGLKSIFEKSWIWLLALIAIHLYLLLATRFTAWPEMLLWPYLVIKGWLPYRDIAMAHNPLLVVDLAIFYKLFGVGIIQLKIYTWVLIILTDLVIFEVVRKMWNNKTALFALAYYIPLQIFYEGNGLWFDLVFAPFALLIFYLIKQKNYGLAGILWALLFLVKQTAFWFLIPIALTFLITKGYAGKKIFFNRFMLGAAPVFAVFLICVFLFGILADYWYWAVSFGIGILPRAEGQIHLPSLLQLSKALLPYLIFIPLLIINRRRYWLLIVWAVAGMMGTYPRWELFHFQPSLPFLAVGFALVFANFNKIKPVIKIFITLLLLINIVQIGRGISRAWGQEVRFYEIKVRQVAQYIIDNNYEGESMLVFGYWDNLYPLTGKVPAIMPWVPTLPWYYSLPGIEDGVLRKLEEKPPPVVIYAKVETDENQSFASCVHEYIKNNYNMDIYFDNVYVYELKK